MSALWVQIAATRGSAPRDAGTAMKVTAETTEGTIGGGALELAAIDRARAMLALGDGAATETLPLGPRLGQCCGGSVTLRYTDTPLAVDRAPDTSTAPGRDLGALWLWGAGHVGRALVDALPEGAARIAWVDDAADRFPQNIPAHVTAMPAADMPLLASRAPVTAQHLIFTYSHEIDLALCASLLRRGARRIGLIGSDTKRTRFRRRLREMGLDPDPITCPIGDKSLGKEPWRIAQGVVAALSRDVVADHVGDTVIRRSA